MKSWSGQFSSQENLLLIIIIIITMVVLYEMYKTCLLDFWYFEN